MNVNNYNSARESNISRQISPITNDSQKLASEQQAKSNNPAQEANANWGIELAKVPETNKLETLNRLLNRFVDHLLANPMKYSMGHSSQEALNFVLDNAKENERKILEKEFSQKNDKQITPNREFINKLDQILDRRMHDEQSKTGVFSSVFHNPDTKAYLNSQDRQTFWPSHIPDELDFT